MKNSHIEWTDHTFNPWEGCTKVSPGCAHCYAEARNQRFAGGANWGPGAPRRRTSAANWNQPLKWNNDWPNIETTAALAGETARRPRVFCASLADWLDDEVPIAWLVDLLHLIHSTPNLDWLLLTKRPQNFRARVGSFAEYVRAPMELQGWVYDWFHGKPPANVWIGTTVEDQQRAEERIPALLKIPAKVRFLSCEPLLGPVDLLIEGECSSWKCPDCGSANVDPDQVSNDGKFWTCPDCKESDEGEADWKPDIHWVICGGESGPGARPMHPDWARSLRGQCEDACVPFFFKQWGEWLPFHSLAEATEPGRKWGTDKSLCILWPSGLKGSAVICKAETAWQEGCRAFQRVGKLKAGRLLDGKEHNEFPGHQPSLSPEASAKGEAIIPQPSP